MAEEAGFGNILGARRRGVALAPLNEGHGALKIEDIDAPVAVEIADVLLCGTLEDFGDNGLEVPDVDAVIPVRIAQNRIAHVMKHSCRSGDNHSTRKDYRRFHVQRQQSPTGDITMELQKVSNERNRAVDSVRGGRAQWGLS